MALSRRRLLQGSLMGGLAIAATGPLAGCDSAKVGPNCDHCSWTRRAVRDAQADLGRHLGTDLSATPRRERRAGPGQYHASGRLGARPETLVFIRDHLAAAHKAIAAGVHLEGYHVWSLLDNFEWPRGYAQRWGMVYVDFDTQVRTPKDSATWYQGVIKRNGI